MINKIFHTLLMVCCTGLCLQAQQTFRPELAVGGSFGTTFSTVGFSPKVQQSMLMGYTFGVTGRFDTEKNVGLQAELNFTQQGWDEKFDEPGYQYSRTIHYIELPFLTHIYFGSRRVKVFLNLGPKIGYAVGEKTKQNIEGAELSSVTEQHDKPVEKKFDWGLCGGPGLEIRTGIGYFLLEGRYYYALGDLYNSRKEDFFTQSPSQVISVKLTYLLPLHLQKK